MAQVFVCSELEMKDGDVRIVRQDRFEVGVYRHAGSYLRLPQSVPAPGRTGLRGHRPEQGRRPVRPRQDVPRPDLRRERAAHRLPVARLGVQAQDRRMRAGSQNAAQAPRSGPARRRRLCRLLRCSIGRPNIASRPRCRGARRRLDDPDRIADADLRALIASAAAALRREGGERHAHAAAAGCRRRHRHRDDDRRHRYSPRAQCAVVRAVACGRP